MAAFNKRTITIATAPPTQVEALCKDGLAVHGSTGLYTVTHVASGRAVCRTNQQRTAKGLAVELLDWYSGWGAEDIPEGQKVAALAFIAKLAAPQPQPTPPLVLAPIYPDYFTPSDELVALDTTIAAGDFGRIADASAVEARELIMARMATGRRAAISEDDVPVKGLVVYGLPPGIEPGYAGVKQLTAKLWQLGKEIDALAHTMVQYHQRGGEFGEPEFRWWLEQEEEFSTLVKAGWCDWAVCVNLFSQLGKDDQEKVTRILGFVGSDKQGWHAYGAKTFLRSKHLPELLRCRRAVKRALDE